MKSVRVYLVFWLSGLLAGVILVERWRRNGDLYVPVEPTPETLDTSIGSTGSSAPAKRPNVVGLVVTGAKLDAARVKQRVAQTRGAGTSTSPDSAAGSADDSAAGSTAGSATSGAE